MDRHVIAKLALLPLGMAVGCGEEDAVTEMTVEAAEAGGQVSTGAVDAGAPDATPAGSTGGSVSPGQGGAGQGGAGQGQGQGGAQSGDAGACTPEQPPRVIVQWTDVRRFSRDAANNFQVVLYENGDFAFLYRGVDVAEDVPTIGYQGAAGDRAFELDATSEDLARPRAFHFRLDASGVPVLDTASELEWFDAEIAGAKLGLLDEQTEAVALPFEFPFLGGSYSEVNVSSNGFLGFSPPFAEYSNTSLPNAAWGAMLAAFWDDLDPEESGSVSFQAIDECAPDCQGVVGGTARVDRCGVCAGGGTGLVPDADRDCAGVCFGGAVTDACGTCGGLVTDAASCGPRPDLVIDEEYMAETIAEDFVDVSGDACLVSEACVTGTGRRRVVRFGTRIANIGSSDLVIGAPEAGNPLWEFDACHSHYHFESHAQYDLIEDSSSRILPIGVKNGFCLRDNIVWDADLASGDCSSFDCESQGISRGCADVYGPELDCQWVDITDVAPGDYTLRVTTNPSALVPELDYLNNSATVRIRITEDEVVNLP